MGGYKTLLAKKTSTAGHTHVTRDGRLPMLPVNYEAMSLGSPGDGMF
jgi:hypothetical protein